VASADGDRTRITTTEDGRELAFCVWGDPAGAPILWMHGTPGSRMLRDPRDRHRQHGLAVCVYDRPGYGRSTRRRSRSHAETVDDVTAVAAALHWDRFAIAGISGGTGPCLATAALLPDRVTRCAVIVGGAPVTAEAMDAGMTDEDRASRAPAIRGDDRALAERFVEVLHWCDAGFPGSGVDDVSRRMLQEVVLEARRQGPAGFIDDSVANYSDWGFAVEEVQAPTRIVAAREDDHFSRLSAEWLAAHIPHAELRWRAGGHLNPEEDADPQLFHWLGHGVECSDG
jgi:pimeloyl-ACP methyl ester carboxylesterase